MNCGSWTAKRSRELAYWWVRVLLYNVYIIKIMYLLLEKREVLFDFLISTKDFFVQGLFLRILSGVLWIPQIWLKSCSNHKYLSTLNHLEYLISNDENGCSGSFPIGSRGRTGAPVVCGHGCFAEMNRQSPQPHHWSTQHGKSRAGRQKRNA